MDKSIDEEIELAKKELEKLLSQVCLGTKDPATVMRLVEGYKILGGLSGYEHGFETGCLLWKPKDGENYKNPKEDPRGGWDIGYMKGWAAGNKRGLEEGKGGWNCWFEEGWVKGKKRGVSEGKQKIKENIKKIYDELYPDGNHGNHVLVEENGCILWKQL